VFKSPEETGSSSKQTAVVYEEDEVDKLLRKQVSYECNRGMIFKYL